MQKKVVDAELRFPPDPLRKEILSEAAPKGVAFF